MASNSTIRVPELKQLLKVIMLNRTSSGSVRLLDASYSAANLGTHDEFMKTDYGKVEELAAKWINQDYIREHIPGSVHFHAEVATFPGKYEKASLYPKDIFERYVRLLGVNQDDDVVVYARGAVGGMLWAARVWWLLKEYGMKKVRVLEGGLDKWKAEGGEVTGEPTKVKKGNWTASDIDRQHFTTFEDLFQPTGAYHKINLLDARPAAQFNGSEPLSFPPNGAPGAHIDGARNIPLPSLLTSTSELKDVEDIKKVLSEAGFDPSKPSVTICNGGTQASLLALVLSKADLPYSVYNGSLREVSIRDPKLIDKN